MEIELKFLVPDDATFTELRQLTQFDVWTFAAGPLRELRDHYFDTADRALRGAGHTCRVRQVGDDAFVATLKGLGGAHKGLHAREEVEAPLPGLVPFAEWPEGEISARVREIIGEAPLEALFVLAQERLPLAVTEEGAVLGELDVDAVTLALPDGRTAHLLVAEIELAPGADGARLEELGARLAGAFALEPTDESKYAWALRQIEPARTGSRGVKLKPDMPMAGALKKLMAVQLKRLGDKEPGVRSGDDPEDLHDMRVATRRLRAAFRVAEPYLHRKTVSRLLPPVRLLAGLLGDVRDTDVLLEALGQYREEHAAAPYGDLQALADAWTRHRAAARAALLRHLDSADYDGFLHDFRDFLETPDAGVRRSGLAGYAPHRVCDALPAVLWDDYGQVRAFGPLPDGTSLEALHRLRICCKRLRYALEFFRGALPPEAETLIATTVRAQDHLGALNDAQVAGGLVHAFLMAWQAESAHDAFRPGAGIAAYLAYQHQRLAELTAGVPAVWDDLTAPEFRNGLGAVVASL